MIENIKALSADIDMTLTGKGEGLPEITKEAFRILREHGVLLGLATGRELEKKLFDQASNWDLDYQFDFLIGMNGGMVWDRFHEDMWSMDLMDQKKMREIMEYMMPLVDKYHIMVNVEGGGNHSIINAGEEAIAMAKRHGFDFIDVHGDLDAFCAQSGYKILFRTEAQYEKEIREYFLSRYGHEFQMIGTYPGTVEVMQKGIDKGSGLERFARNNSIDMKDIISFGDNENDNSMLVASGWGVSLKDGAELTRQLADDITDYDCMDAGVGHYLFDHYIQQKGWTE